MLFTGFTLVYVIKTSLSELIVAMVRHPSTNSTELLKQKLFLSVGTRSAEVDLDVCPGSSDTETNQQDGEFDWDEELQGYVLSSYYYGFTATQLLGGWLCDMYGGKIVFGPAILAGGILSLLSPVAARWHVAAFIAVRVLMGTTSGLILPTLNNMVGKWFPKEERASMASIALAGVSLGIVIGLSASGYVADLFDWSVIYYFFGILSLLWYIPWLFVVYDTPEDHPRISEQEKNKILTSIGHKENEKITFAVPWLAMLTSLPLWAHVALGIGYAWIGTTNLMELPTYLSNVLHFDLKKSGILSALPYIFSPLSGTFFAFLSQWLQRKGYVSQLTAYRIFNTICAVGTSVCLLAITLIGCDSTSIMVLLVLSVMCTSAFLGGSYLNNLDICSNFAGTAAGISHTFVAVTGIFTPIVVGYLTEDGGTLTQWSTVFYIAIGILMATYLFFMVFGSVKEQPWNRPPAPTIDSHNPGSTAKKSEQV